MKERTAIAVIQIFLYIPVFVLGLILTFRNGFSKKAGWLYMVLLSIFVFVAGILSVAGEHGSSPNLSIIASGLESAGMSPLINATIGFLKTIAQFSALAEESFVMGKGLTLLEVGCLIAFAAYGYGASSIGNAKSQDALDRAYAIRHVTVIAIGIIFVATVGVTLYAFAHRGQILKYRRRLLSGILASLPFITVRVGYSCLGAFAKPTIRFDPDGNTLPLHPDDWLQKLSPTNGSIGLFIACALVVQYVAVLIICVTGVRTPLKKDEPASVRPTVSQQNN